MKINKKQIVFLSLALVVCIAVYLNWRYLDQVDLINPESVTVDAENDEVKMLGEAELVETVAKDVETYFSECRLNKQQTRDEALELLQKVADSAESTNEVREKANNDLIDMARVTEVESTIENLVKAKGFADCMVHIGEDSVNVVVATQGLSNEQAAQINEIVISEADASAAAVKIVEIKTE